MALGLDSFPYYCWRHTVRRKRDGSTYPRQVDWAQLAKITEKYYIHVTEPHIMAYQAKKLGLGQHATSKK